MPPTSKQTSRRTLVTGLLIVVILVGAGGFAVWTFKANSLSRTNVGDQMFSTSRVSFAVQNPVSGAKGYDYTKDQSNAYWATWQDEGTIAGADPSTFTTNARVYPFAIDKSSVFLLGRKLENADPSTFATFPNSQYAKDKNQVYWYGGPSGTFTVVVKGANLATFMPFVATVDSTGTSPSYYAKDSTHIYCQGSVLAGADLNTFRQTGSAQAKDKNHVYETCGIYEPNNP